MNPLVAVALGSLVLGEKLSGPTLLGAGIVVTAVFVSVRREATR